MMDELNIEKVSRAQYLKTFIKSVKRLSNIHVEYEEKIGTEWQHTFFNFIEGRLTKSRGTIEVSKFFIEFFGNLKELYEINPEILSVLNKYQRILYVLYVCNRMSTTNYFSVDRLKERFNINSDKMPDKQFIKKIRDTNKELKDFGLIAGFKEIKAFDKDGKNDNPRQPTIQFDVDYSYKSLYPKVHKLREIIAMQKSNKVEKKNVKGLNLDAFESDIPDSFKETIEASKTTN
jgi:hypothetical protein